MPATTLPLLARRRIASLATLSVAAWLVGCASPAANLPPLPSEAPGPYRLGAGDQLRVSVFNDPRLTGEFRVTDTGNVALPLVGSIAVAGRTAQESERLVERAMRDKSLFNDPSVAIEVLEYRPVFVLGMVERGGQTPYRPGMTVLSAVAVMGGFNYRAVTDEVGITRIGENGRAVEYRGERLSLLQPGDVVTVYERRL
ncbi:polysaccharide biosynthesis/export family protein [Muricoccus radiodurans]|uniref:polysaccharide biosynthesis/export family protein n=1 Tax=Muricoccus radiodurans TaxID=2231721 RepID=UPI003CF0EC7B